MYDQRTDATQVVFEIYTKFCFQILLENFNKKFYKYLSFPIFYKMCWTCWPN